MRCDGSAPLACKPAPRAWRCVAAAAVLALVGLSGCGGGGGNDNGNATRVQNCDAASRKAALADYFNEWYFWTTLSPKPAANGSHALASYFDALLYAGGSAGLPADRWSYYESTESFNRFFGDGRNVGYGVAVAGLEVEGRPDLPLYVRYVDPRSPAASAGIVRGDRILSLNGQSAAELIAAGDFSLLTAGATGQTLRLELSGAGGNRSVTLQSATYDLVPVPAQQVVATPSGRRVGYVMVKDMVSQAVSPATEAFASFRSAGVTELVLDLRYNGGGLVSVARDIASLVGGGRSAGRNYTTLLYNAKRAAENNQSYSFNDPPQALGLQRVYILAGERTCSASEQLANGLRPFVNVVLVGDTTCGKPVGFLPHDDRCGNTYSVVNFESVNANNEGRYFDGLSPTCAVSEDWSKALGSTAEPLLATALRHADGGACTAPATARQRALAAAGGPRIDEGERRSMIADR
jgi:carboxyl-terminal processing protease